MKKLLLLSILCFTSFLNYAAPLPAADVFRVKVKLVDPNTFVVSWNIASGYFLYSDRISLTEQENNNLHLGTIRFPKPLTKTDHLNRTFTIYRNQLDLPVAVLGERPGDALITLNYQGCADDGFCYPPEKRQIKLTIDNKLALTQASLQEETSLAKPAVPPPTALNKVQDLFKKNNWFMIIISFFGFGLLLSFTPCILPMVPVLSGIIVGHGNDLSTRKAFLLSLSYVLSMSATYALVGAVVALVGSNLQILMQAPWMISLFSLIFVLLALSMFGFYELKLPVSWQAKFAHASRSQNGGHYVGAAIMGCLSTLILSPCVTAPLIGALSYIAQSGNVALGSLALFFLGLGMGTPLLLIGSSAGKWLPQAGHWMNGVKAFFGIMMLAIAIYLMSRILPGALVMSFWAALFVFSGIYCGAFLRAISNLDKFRQGLGIILLVYGLLVLIGASMGSTNPLQPLAGLRIQPNYAHKLSKITVKSVGELQQAIASAKGKPIMLDYYADWCTSCQIMEATTFKDPGIIKALADFVTITVDVTANDTEEKALLAFYDVIAPPTFIFLNRQGEEEKELRLVGEVSTEEFLTQLKNADKGRERND